MKHACNGSRANMFCVRTHTLLFSSVPWLPCVLSLDDAWSLYGWTGLSVIGLYLIAGLKDFEKSAPKLCAVAKHARTDRADGCFLLHIEAATGKVLSAGFALLKYFEVCVSVPVIWPQFAILCSASQPIRPWRHLQAHSSDNELGSGLLCSSR